MNYIVTSICIGRKYEPIKSHWINRINAICINPNPSIKIIEHVSQQMSGYAWWDIVRLNNNITLCHQNQLPVVHIDMDIIIEKNIQEIVHLPYDFIISTEIGGNQSFPKECSQKLGFGVCSGFYVIKPSAIPFMLKIAKCMKQNTYGSQSDQVNIMNYITNNLYSVTTMSCELENHEFINKIIEIEDIRICVLDFDIITRDPILQKRQYGNHINIDNVGGTNNFIKYFYNSLEQLPLTCRCGKQQLGDSQPCSHIQLRAEKNK